MAAAIVLVGCSKNVEIPQGTQEMLSFETGKYTLHAGFESVDTKTSVDDNLHLYWTEDDRISVFEGNTYNTEYVVSLDEDVNNRADFNPVSTGLHSGDLLSNQAFYAVYPYVKKTSIDAETCAISFTLPAVQQYAPNSFGLGANTMVAVTKDLVNDTFLSFKNVGGFVVFSLYGEGTVIKSITFSSQAGEALEGKAVITASNASAPTVSFTSPLDNTHSSLTLDCGDGVSLGATQDEAKAFWFVVPPVTLSNGFAVTFTRTDGETITRTASGSKTVERNKIFRIPALKVVFQDFTSNGIETLNELAYEW